MTIISASQAYYIKLGQGGEWEKKSIEDGVLLFGYSEAPHDPCVVGDWDAVWYAMRAIRPDDGAATRDVSQIRIFYESDGQAIFITFSGGLLYWCRPVGPVELLADGNHLRRTVDGWHKTSLGGVLLTTDRLSGHLLKVQMFRGTICKVKAAEYLLRKLGDEVSLEVAAARKAELALLQAIVGLMQLLTWQDFELLVDLVFSTSGWRRIGDVGRTQKTVDLEIRLPSTSERAFVQIKSEATTASLKEYVSSFSDMEAYDRMFFVWHTGNLPDSEDQDGVVLIGPQRLSRLVLDAGLSSWLLEKVS